jgi:hypothetical protein
MSALSADKILNPDVSIQSKVVAWLVNKSDTTILLFLLLYGVWVKSDTMLTAVQAGYDKNAAALEKSVDKLVQEKEKDRQFMLSLINRELHLPQGSQSESRPQ